MMPSLYYRKLRRSNNNNNSINQNYRNIASDNNNHNGNNKNNVFHICWIVIRNFIRSSRICRIVIECCNNTYNNVLFLQRQHPIIVKLIKLGIQIGLLILFYYLLRYPILLRLAFNYHNIMYHNPQYHFYNYTSGLPYDDTTNNVNYINSNIQYEPNIEYNTTNTCTFHDLLYTFGNLSAFQQQIHQCNSTKTSCCWNLKDIIVRVPVAAILNRNSLIKLGGGRRGSVYKAIIDLSSSGTTTAITRQNKYTQCSVAIKTDFCTTQSTLMAWWNNNPFVATAENDATTGSCIMDHAKLSDSKSFIGSEYTGALLYYSHKLHEMMTMMNDRNAKQQHQQPYTEFGMDIDAAYGILPTYAVITTKKPLRNIFYIPRSYWEGTPMSHDQSTVIGVIMPLYHFDSVYTYDFHPNINDDETSNNASTISNSKRRKNSFYKHSVYDVNSDISTFKRIFLQAARGLQHVNTNIGLAYQDIRDKNVGMLFDTKNNSNIIGSLVHDHSHIGIAPQRVLRDNQSTCYDNISCRYCIEESFPIANRTEDIFIDNSNNTYDNFQSDYYHFRKVLVDVLNHCPGSSEDNNNKHEDTTLKRSCMELRNTILNNATNINELVTILSQE